MSEKIDKYIKQIKNMKDYQKTFIATLIFTFIFIIIFLTPASTQINQTTTTLVNVTDPECLICTPQTCARCLPKKWYEWADPNRILSSILTWVSKNSGLNLHPLAISLLAFLIMIILTWLIVSKLQTIFLILIIITVVALVVVILLSYLNLLPI